MSFYLCNSETCSTFAPFSRGRTCRKADMYEINVLVGLHFSRKTLKGNRVQIPDSPAAVSFFRQCTDERRRGSRRDSKCCNCTLWQTSHCWRTTPMGRRRRANESEDLPMAFVKRLSRKKHKTRPPQPLHRRGMLCIGIPPL